MGRRFAGGACNIGWVTIQNGGQRLVNRLPARHHQGRRGALRPGERSERRLRRCPPSLVISSLAHVEPLPLGAAIVVSRSPDGIHWSDPVTVADGRPSGDLDKNWTACDNHPTSPFYGHCYTVFDDYDQGNLIEMSTSTDGGKTWGAPQELPAGDLGIYNQLGIGGQPLVQPDGTVIVPIDNLVETEVRAFRSTDGGASWSTTVSVSPIARHAVAGGLARPAIAIGRDRSRRERLRRLAGLPLPCRLFVKRPGPKQIGGRRSNGRPRRIPIDPLDSGADHFIPGLAVNPHAPETMRASRSRTTATRTPPAPRPPVG